MLIRARLLALQSAVACLLLGCSLSAGFVPTQPSGVTQQLLIRSLERGLARLDLGRFAGRSVDVDVFVQAGDQAFVQEFVVAWLKAHGARVVANAPALRLKVFASVLGTDRGETLIGIPAFQAPVVNVPFPEIALFKWTRNRGQSELRVYALDGKTEDFVEQLPLGVGHSKSDDFTVLLFIGFTRSDLDKPAN